MSAGAQDHRSRGSSTADLDAILIRRCHAVAEKAQRCRSGRTTAEQHHDRHHNQHQSRSPAIHDAAPRAPDLLTGLRKAPRESTLLLTGRSVSGAPTVNHFSPAIPAAPPRLRLPGTPLQTPSVALAKHPRPCSTHTPYAISPWRRTRSTPHRRALKINLDPRWYGTFRRDRRRPGGRALVLPRRRRRGHHRQKHVGLRHDGERRDLRRARALRLARPRLQAMLDHEYELNIDRLARQAAATPPPSSPSPTPWSRAASRAATSATAGWA